MDLRIRPILPEDIQPASNLVVGVFRQTVAPLYGSDGIREFLAYAAPGAFAERLRRNHVAFVAAHATLAIVGVVEVRDHRHLSMFFVETALQRTGIGRMLLDASLQACKSANPRLQSVTVNASPNSVGAYEKFGFLATQAEQEKNGIRFVPMALTLAGTAGP